MAIAPRGTTFTNEMMADMATKMNSVRSLYQMEDLPDLQEDERVHNDPLVENPHGVDISKDASSVPNSDDFTRHLSMMAADDQTRAMAAPVQA